MMKNNFLQLILCGILYFTLNSSIAFADITVSDHGCHNKNRGSTGSIGATGVTGITGAGSTGATGTSFGNYASALNDGNTALALSTVVLTYNPIYLAGNVTYGGGVFNINNSSSLTPAVYLVNAAYSSFGSEIDNGLFTIEVDINSTGLNPYGNNVYATNGTTGGGAATVIVIVPPLSSAQLVLSTNGQFSFGIISLTIAQIDNQ